jgi:hypothetical protein
LGKANALRFVVANASLDRTLVTLKGCFAGIIAKGNARMASKLIAHLALRRNELAFPSVLACELTWQK